MSEHSPELLKIRKIISESFDLPIGEVGGQTPLFSSGVLDSFHLVELIGILEKAFGRKIRPGEINLENLDTPERMASLVGSATP